MKIDSAFSPARTSAAQGKDAPQRTPSESASTGETPSSVTHLSSANRKSDSQDIDAARVAELRQAIRDGRFSVSAERIADGLIDSVREDLGLN